MWFRSAIDAPKFRASSKSPRQRTGLPLAARRVSLEPLEDRCMLSFAPVATYAAGYGPRAVDAGDFNGDGRADLVTANATYELGVLLNNGDGTFQSNVSVSLDGTMGMDVVVGDLNHDGKLDLTVSTNASLKVLLGNGDGSFTPGARQSLVNGRYFSVALGDLNDDGDLDVALSNWDGTDLSVLLGNGDGTFGTPQGWAVGPAAQQVDIADINGDGKQDLVTTLLFDSVKVLLGNGNGTFHPAQTVSVGAPNPQGQAVGDINGDGKLDLAVTSFSAGGYSGPYGGYTTYSDVKVIVLLGHGDGTFAAGNGYLAGDAPLEPVVLADFDRDGKLDVAAATYETGNVNVLRGNGDGTFDAAQAYFTGGVNGGPSDMVSAALNGDGTLDIATANYGWNTVAVFLEGAASPLLPSITVSDASVTEGNSGTRAAVFTATLSSASTGPVTVNYGTTNGTAAANGDYQSKSGTLTFAPGESTQSITVLVKGDKSAEPDETFLVNLSDASGATIADGQGVGAILDDDSRISISDVTKNEGKSGTTKFVFTVSLSTASSERVTVNYATANGSARKNDDDYVAKSGKLTFAPGETSKTVTILVKGDKKNEANESFFVNLANAKGALLDDDQGEGTILNDDTSGGKDRKWHNLLAFASAVDAAFDDRMSPGRKKRGW